jgi:hypothetical protein
VIEGQDKFSKLILPFREDENLPVGAISLFYQVFIASHQVLCNGDYVYLIFTKDSA